MSINIKEIEYLNIEILSFYIERIENAELSDTFDVSVKVDTKPFLDKGNVAMSKIDISVKATADDRKECFILSIGNVLEVANINNYLIKSEEEDVLNEELKLSIAELVISTARGIFWEKTRGTFLQNVMLPIVDLVKK